MRYEIPKEWQGGEVYVAGSAESVETRKLADDVADALEAQGLRVPFRWTATDVRAHYLAGRLDLVGQMERLAIRDADLLVVLPGRLGTAIELGIAIGSGKPAAVFVVDDLSPRSSSWLAVPFVHTASIDLHRVAEVTPAIVVDHTIRITLARRKFPW